MTNEPLFTDIGPMMQTGPTVSSQGAGWKRNRERGQKVGETGQGKEQNTCLSLIPTLSDTPPLCPISARFRQFEHSAEGMA